LSSSMATTLPSSSRHKPRARCDTPVKAERP
jgi:hypothetical protein